MPAEIVAIVDIPEARDALTTLLDAASAAPWTVGWVPQSAAAAGTASASSILDMATHVTVLQLQKPNYLDKKARSISMGQTNYHAKFVEGAEEQGHRRSRGRLHAQMQYNLRYIEQASSALVLGSRLVARGCPFGALVNLKYHEFASAGVASSLIVSRSSGNRHVDTKHLNTNTEERPHYSLILSDVKCLPGMDGGPVHLVTQTCSTESEFEFVGMLLPPLQAPTVGAEFSAVLPVRSILSAVARAMTLPFLGLDSVDYHGDLETISSLDNDDNVVQGALPMGPLLVNTTTPTTTNNNNKNKPNNTRSASALKTHTLSTETNGTLKTLRAIVAIDAGAGWASGLLVTHEGHVFTNAHALPKHNKPLGGHRRQDTMPVRVLASDGSDGLRLPSPPHEGAGFGARWYDAEVVHVFQPPLDLAVLKLRTDSLPGSKPSGAAATLFPAARFDDEGQSPCRDAPQGMQGRAVIVAGFPVWRPTSSRGSIMRGHPIVTSGNIAKVIKSQSRHAISQESNTLNPSLRNSKLVHETDAVLLTTAAVYSGASGGAVIDPTTGTVLGLITSNTRLVRPNDHTRSTKAGVLDTRAELYPHMNYSIPAAVLKRVVEVLRINIIDNHNTEFDTRGNNPCLPDTTGSLFCGVGTRQLGSWDSVEDDIRECGVLDVWRGLHRMDGFSDHSRSHQLPPKFAEMLDRVKRGRLETSRQSPIVSKSKL